MHKALVLNVTFGLRAAHFHNSTGPASVNGGAHHVTHVHLEKNHGHCCRPSKSSPSVSIIEKKPKGLKKSPKAALARATANHTIIALVVKVPQLNNDYDIGPSPATTQHLPVKFASLVRNPVRTMGTEVADMFDVVSSCRRISSFEAGEQGASKLR